MDHPVHPIAAQEADDHEKGISGIEAASSFGGHVLIPQSDPPAASLETLPEAGSSRVFDHPSRARSST